MVTIDLNLNSSIFDIPPFELFNLRSRGNKFRLDSHILSKNADILCLGGCDVAGMRPNDNEPFYWPDYFPEKTNKINKNLSFDILIKHIEEYIERFGPPKKIYHVVQPPAKTILINNQFYRLYFGSEPAVNFLYTKNVINQEELQLLLHIVKTLKSMCKNEIIRYYEENFLALKKILNHYRIDYYWLPMATKAGNIFFAEIIQDLMLISAGKYIGWIETVDRLPDSSLGRQTQKNISTLFLSNSII